MRRREFIALLSGAATAGSLAARAAVGPDARVGVLMPCAEDDPETSLRDAAQREKTSEARVETPGLL
jgi:hypothetical protein